MALKSSNKVDTNTYEIEVTVDAQTFADACKSAYMKQRKSIQIPGFRKGKATQGMVEKVYGEGAFYEEALEILYPNAVQSAIDEAELKVVGQPFDLDVPVMSKAEGVEMKMKVTTYPEVKLGEYKGLEAKMLDTEATDDDVAEELKNMQDRNSRLVTVEDRAAEMGDTAEIDFEGFVDGVAFEGGKGENYPLELGSGSFIPGFEEQVVGHKSEEEFDVNVTFPEEYAEELAGKDAVFKCKIHEIKSKELPELDDDFAKDVSEFDTLAEYKEDVKKNLTEKKAEDARRAKEDAAVDKAIENAQMDIPELMTKTECRQMMDDFSRRMQQQGLSMEQYFQFTGMTADKMMEDMKPQALKRIQTRLVLEKVAEAENIQPSEEEITEEIQKMADAYKMEADKIREAIGESGLEQMKKDMAVQKAVTVIADAAKEV